MDREILVGACIDYIDLPFPWLFTYYKGVINLATEPASWIGNAIGGIMSPFVAMIAAYLMYKAFDEQRKFNRQQSFERKFYEIIHIHRQNIEEMKLGTLHGRQVFPEIWNEFCLAYAIIDDIINSKKLEICNAITDNIRSLLESKTIELNKRKLAYNIVYYGFQPLQDSKIDNDKEYKMLTQYLGLNKIYNNIHSIRGVFDTAIININNQANMPYKYFDGQIRLLHHYYMHLQYSVEFVEQEAPKDKKKHYMELIRGQLSICEQALLWCLAKYCDEDKNENQKWWWSEYFDKNDKNGELVKYMKYVRLEKLLDLNASIEDHELIAIANAMYRRIIP